MKHISELFEKMTPEEMRELLIDRTEVDTGTGRVINYIFKRLSGFIPAFKYSSDCQLSLDLIKREWTYSIQDSKIDSIEKINAGIDNLRNKGCTFLPPPGEFVKLCKINHENRGLKSTEDAYSESCFMIHPSSSKVWSHVTVRHAACSMSNELRTLSKIKSFPLFEKKYAESIELFFNGQLSQELPSPENINAPGKKTPGVAFLHLNKLKGLLK